MFFLKVEDGDIQKKKKMNMKNVIKFTYFRNFIKFMKQFTNKKWWGRYGGFVISYVTSLNICLKSQHDYVFWVLVKFWYDLAMSVCLI